MKVTIEQTEKLLSGNQSFTQMGFSMMLTRLRSLYKKDSSKVQLMSYMSEINMFLKKFEMIMGTDYDIISKI